MQTFLPYPSFVESVACLDSKRLGCQRKEAMQILKTLREGRKAWANHPAVLMWKGYEDALSFYYHCCLSEWEGRGYKNNMPYPDLPKWMAFPSWLGDPVFHASHRSNLLRKDPEHYGQFGWKEPNDLDYFWPVKITKDMK